MKDKEEILKEELNRLSRINEHYEKKILENFEAVKEAEAVKNNVLAMCEIAKTKELI